MIHQGVFGSIAGSLPQTSPGAADRASLNAITYTPTEIGSQTYLLGSPSYNIDKMNDGDPVNTGMIADVPTGNFFDANLTAAAPFWLNRLTIYGGQFNSTGNGPGRLRLYADSSLASLLYETTLTLNTNAAQTRDLSAVAALNTAASSYTIVLDQHTGVYVAVLELQLFGAFS